MNAVAPTPHGWTRGKFLLVAVGILAGQASLILLLAERSRPLPLLTSPRSWVRVLPAAIGGEDLSKYIFALDPTIFPTTSSPNGFAERAWSHLRPNEVVVSTRTEPPSFLEFAANPLRTQPVPSEPGRPGIPFELAAQSGPSEDATPSPTGIQPGRERSSFRIEGDLAGSQIGAPVVLNDWTNARLLTNTVVEFAVTPAGQVVSARLLSGCGLDMADLRAVAVVSGLRFRPGDKTPARQSDRAIFYWNTVAPPATNSAVGIIPATAQ